MPLSMLFRLFNAIKWFEKGTAVHLLDANPLRKCFGTRSLVGCSWRELGQLPLSHSWAPASPSSGATNQSPYQSFWDQTALQAARIQPLAHQPTHLHSAASRPDAGSMWWPHLLFVIKMVTKDNRLVSWSHIRVSSKWQKRKQARKKERKDKRKGGRERRREGRRKKKCWFCLLEG